MPLIPTKKYKETRANQTSSGAHPGWQTCSQHCPPFFHFKASFSLESNPSLYLSKHRTDAVRTCTILFRRMYRLIPSSSIQQDRWDGFKWLARTSSVRCTKRCSLGRHLNSRLPSSSAALANFTYSLSISLPTATRCSSSPGAMNIGVLCKSAAQLLAAHTNCRD